ncbi:type I-E CRISPR-associated protein Cas5/CasD [Arthrobacter sp.]|uniref:type I-E CRISPR-associated protein Cas5/CasD n=1 Tax=Arthrobacter sp. TaxID=1667 RepID=UPI0026DFDCF0|nr:type I-E CRISPR-associated protein Cas5/CasD [Arthrobacter sp.]MDO5752438.1 type I-E CRISPR-associated protein Cas5/CasD [Arthrobacter sp.]
MSSLYLRFAAPYQSWAGPRVTGNHVNTALIPSRSGVTGLAAAALGARKGEWPRWLEELSIDVRADNPGVLGKDFQTINPRPEVQTFIERIWTASGQKGKAPASFTPDAQKGTAIVKRTYLAGAEFIVRLGHPERTHELVQAFATPGFSPYLGRKSFAPSFPFLLGAGEETLLERAPSGHSGALGVHVLDGRDNTYPDRTVTVPQRPLTERTDWWASHATIPLRG